MPKFAIPALLLSSTLLAQGTVTVPAAYASQDASSLLWLPGVSASVRQQTIIDASHLQALVGRDLTALEFRREADNASYTGGNLAITVRLSHAPLPPLEASASFAFNLPAPTTVFAGNVTVPNAPPMPGPTVGWTPERTIRIPFTTPFRYQGGPLTVDLSGTASATSPIGFWPVDAAWDQTTGQTANVGAACGLFTNALGESAHVAASSLVAGGMAVMTAAGTENGIALLFLGAPAALPGTPLDLFLPGVSPACRVFLPLPATMLVTTFAPIGVTGVPGLPGRAMHRFRLPNHGSLLGASFGCQWMDLMQFATSNGVNCTIAATPPVMGMVVLHGEPGAVTGQVYTHQAHVMRFTYQ